MLHCMSDHGSAHIKYWLFGLYTKMHDTTYLLVSKYFLYLTHTKLYLFVTKYIYNITQVMTVVFYLFIHRSILSMLHYVKITL